jgi:hypothetical protein
MADDATESKGEDGGGRPVRRPPLVLQLPKALEGGKLDLHAVLAHGDGVPRLILDLLLPATLESVRVASKCGWKFIERNLWTALVNGLLSPETTCGKLYKKWLQSYPTGAPATGAEMLALCRGLQKKAVMINLVNELQVACEVKEKVSGAVYDESNIGDRVQVYWDRDERRRDGRRGGGGWYTGVVTAFTLEGEGVDEEVAGKHTVTYDDGEVNHYCLATKRFRHILSFMDMPLKEWKGVTMGADGQVVKIDFSRRCKGGAVDKLVLPEGMQTVNFSDTSITGTLVTLPPPGMKMFDVSGSGVKIDVAAIEWPANATALVYEYPALVCRTTNPDESKEGAETSEIHIKCRSDQVIGCLSWHCRVEPKAGDRIPGIKYNTLTREDIEPYLNGRSYEDLKTGDEIVFPEPDRSAPTGESLVGLAFTYTSEYGSKNELTFTSFDAKTGMHTFAKYGRPVSVHLQDLPVQWESINFQGSDAYFASGLMLGPCTIGDLAQLHLPVGMKDLNLHGTKVTGDVTQLRLPNGMQDLNLSAGFARIGYRMQIMGDIAHLNLPVGMQTVNFSDTSIIGDLAQLQLPVGMKDLNLRETKVTAPPGCPRGRDYNFSYNEDNINRLRSWILPTATQGGAAGEDGNGGKAVVDREEAMDMEALRAFAESVGCKGDIMDGVVTECAGGAIEEIHWKSKNLDGTLPVGNLNMPKRRVMDLSGNQNLKIDVAAIEWPANATALVFDNNALVCRTTDPDESKEGAEMSKFRIKCDADQVIGDIGQLQLPVGMKDLNLRGCEALTGDLTQWHLPERMKNLNLAGAKVTGDIAQLNLPVGMQTVNFSGCKDLTGDIAQLTLPVGIQTVNFGCCEGLTGTLVTMPPTSMKDFDIKDTGVKIDVAAIEWPANATALVYQSDDYAAVEDSDIDNLTGCDLNTLVCRTTDPDESKAGAETGEIRIVCERDQVIGCLTWHCHVEPKVGVRIPGIKYDILMPEDIEPYLNDRSYENLKVGDEIAFPEPDSITPESLVGLRMAATSRDVVYEGTFDGFDISTGKHEVVFDNGEKQSWDIKGGEVRGTYPEPFVFEGAEAYFGRGVCIIRDVIGNLVLPEGMQTANFGWTGVTGDLAQLQLPVGMKYLNLRETKVAGDIAQLNLLVGMQTVNFRDTSITGCLSWHCRVEPTVGDRIRGMKYDTLTPQDIEPYLNGRSWKDLKVGDEIVFPEPDGSAPTGESLVGLSFTYYEDEFQDEEESKFISFDAKTGMHMFDDDDGRPVSLNLRNGSDQFKKIKFEGSDAYFASGLMLGPCTIGDLAQLHLPVGMKDLNLRGCKALTGTLVTMPPTSMKDFDIKDTGVKIDVAAIEWPANATALVYEYPALVCRTTDPDESKAGAGMGEIRIVCEQDQVIAPPGCPRGSSYDFNYNEDDLNRLRGWHLSLMATQGGATGEDENEGKAGGDGEGATEMEALRAFAESVGYKGRKGDIMYGVVTECAGGAIEEIHWKGRYGTRDLFGRNAIILNGTLPVGDLNMPKLRVLDLGENKNLKGDLAQLHLPVGMKDLNLSEANVTGDIGRLNLPVGMQSVNFKYCGDLTGAVDKLLLPEGMQTVNFTVCVGLTGDLAQFKLPVGMQNLYLNFTGVTGAVDKLVLPDGMQTVNFTRCKGLTGAVDKFVLPVGMQSVDFSGCKDLRGDIAQMKLPVGMKYLNLHGCEMLTGDLAQMNLPVGMKHLNLGGCKALTGKLVVAGRKLLTATVQQWSGNCLPLDL